MGRTHRVGGVALWLGTCAGLGVPTGWALVGTSVAWSASLWPDWDHPQATLARKLGPITYGFSRWVERRFGGHRAGTHSLLVGVPLAGLLGLLFGAVVSVAAVVVVGAPVGILGPVTGTVGLAAAVGALSHVVLDFVTCNCGGCDERPRRGQRRPWSGQHRAGVEVVWPVRRRRYGVPLTPVGGPLESAARLVLLAVSGVAAYLVVI